MSKFLDKTGLTKLWSKIKNTFIKIDGSNGTDAGTSALIRTLGNGDADVTDNTMIVTSYSGGETSATPMYYRRKASYLWGYIKSKDGAGSGLDADLLDGKHANQFASGTTTPKKSLNATGWYRVYTSGNGNAYGESILLGINRAWINANNENYLFAITVGFGGNINITQLSGTVNTKLITAIRVVWKNNSYWYVDMFYNSTSANEVIIQGVGPGTFTEPTAGATIPDGFSFKNFDTLNNRASIEYSYEMTKTVIDASGLDENTWYPVTMAISHKINNAIIQVYNVLSTNVPSWATHSQGFSVNKMWMVQGSGYGAQSVYRTVFMNSYMYAPVDPVRGINQLQRSSTEYVYVRGGGKYNFYTSHNIMPILRTVAYTAIEQTVSPTTSLPYSIKVGVSDDFNVAGTLTCTNINAPIATIGNNGLMSKEDKDKLDECVKIKTITIDRSVSNGEIVPEFNNLPELIATYGLGNVRIEYLGNIYSISKNILDDHVFVTDCIGLVHLETPIHQGSCTFLQIYLTENGYTLHYCTVIPDVTLTINLGDTISGTEADNIHNAVTEYGIGNIKLKYNNMVFTLSSECTNSAGHKVYYTNMIPNIDGTAGVESLWYIKIQQTNDGFSATAVRKNL